MKTAPEPTPVRIPAYGLTLNALDWAPGGGTPVLFLHGWMDHARGFDWVIQALPPDLRAIALDFRGHGQSDHLAPGAQYQITGYVLDVEATLDALGLTHVHLVGHSMGGSVAFMFAAARPERVRSLTVIENLGTPGGAVEDAVNRLVQFLDESKRPVRKRTYATLEDAVARVRENNPGLPPEAAEYMTRHGTRPVEGGVQFTFDPRLRHRMGINYDEAQLHAVLSKVRCPIQILYGTQGLRMPEELMESRLKTLGSPPMIAVEGGHHLHLDRPAEVAGHLARHISRAEAG